MDTSVHCGRSSVVLLRRLSLVQSESSVPVQRQQSIDEEPALTGVAFCRLLEWLDDGVSSDGKRYLEVRRRLVSYFDRRNRQAAEDLADETFNRVSRTLQQGPIAVRPPARYCYVIARFVLLEAFRRERRHVHLDEWRTGSGARTSSPALAATSDSAIGREHRLDCLDRCLQQLLPAQRELIVEYYRDSQRQKIERRRRLAAQLGITMNALGIRALRIRDTLMNCVKACRPEAPRI